MLLAAPTLARGQESPAQAPPAASVNEDGQTFAFEYIDAELPDVVREAAERTGQSFLFDDRLRGKVTITAPRPVGREELLALLTAALRIKDYAVVRSPSGAQQIVPITESAGKVEYSESTPRAFVDTPQTTLVQLHAARAGVLLQALQPLLGRNAVAQAFEPTNTLILSATEGELHRALTLIRALDRAEERRLVIVRPRYRDAEDLLPLVQGTFPESRRASETLRIFVDARSNALLIEGPEELVADVREYINTLDLPLEGRGGIHVVKILHADAGELAEVLQQAAGGSAQLGRAGPAVAASDALAEREFALSVDVGTNSLVIRSDVEAFRAIARLIAALDVDTPSVTVKATIFQVDTGDSLQVAIDSVVPFTRPATPSDGVASLRSLNTGDPSGLSQTPQDLGQGLLLRYISKPVTFTRTGADGQPVTEVVPGYGVNVRAQASDTNTRLISEPTLLARSGSEQEIFIGNNVPIVSATQTSAAGAAGAVSTADPLTISQNIERQDVGITLRVEPTVPTEGPVRLDLRIERSALAPSIAGNTSAVGPTLLQQSVESTLYLEDGAGAVIGVQGESSLQDTRSGTPWLMDLPGLGWLFSSTNTRQTRTDLVVAVQIQVIRSPEDLELESIRRRVALERSVAGLERLPVAPEDSPFAVLVATTDSREAAESIATGLDLGARRAEVVPWQTGGQERFDVYFLGFDRYEDAMVTNLEVRGRGFEPEVVPLPSQP